MSILATIIEHKKKEIGALDAQALRRLAESSPVPRDFLTAISSRQFALSEAKAETKRGEGRRVREESTVCSELISVKILPTGG